MSINIGIFSGRLGSDPEIRFTKGGKAVCSVNLAVDSGWGDNKRTEWVKCVFWDKLAETVSKYRSKGEYLVVTGERKTSEYTAKDGSQRKTEEYVIRDIDFGPRMDAQPSQGRSAQPSMPARGNGGGGGEELPF